jgi:hypothetical protein
MSSTKKLLLTATCITSLMFAIAGTVLAQDQEPSDNPPAATSSEDQEANTAAEKVENGDAETGDIARGDPAETPVLQAADEAPEPPPEGYNPPITIPVQDPDWLPSGDPLPRGSAHSWSEDIVEDGKCWTKVYTTILRPDGNSVTYYHVHQRNCPPPLPTPVDDDPASTAAALLGGSDLLDGPPAHRDGDDRPTPHVDAPHDLPPGTDWVKPGANGVSYEHHTDGSMTIKRDGKVIGQIAPAITASKTQTKDGSNAADNGAKSQTGVKAQAVNDQARVGLANSGKQALVEDHRASSLAQRTDTKVAVAKMDAAMPHQAVTNGIERTTMGDVAGLGHNVPVTSLDHGVSGLGHTMNLPPMAGLGRMGGMGSMMGGMHLGGFKMR